MYGLDGRKQVESWTVSRYFALRFGIILLLLVLTRATRLVRFRIVVTSTVQTVQDIIMATAELETAKEVRSKRKTRLRSFKGKRENAVEVLPDDESGEIDQTVTEVDVSEESKPAASTGLPLSPPEPEPVGPQVLDEPLDGTPASSKEPDRLASSEEAGSISSASSGRAKKTPPTPAMPESSASNRRRG